MVNKRDSELTSITGAGLADGDLFRVVDISDTTDAASGTSKNITKAELSSVMGGGGAVDSVNTMTGDVLLDDLHPSEVTGSTGTSQKVRAGDSTDLYGGNLYLYGGQGPAGSGKVVIATKFSVDVASGPINIRTGSTHEYEAGLISITAGDSSADEGGSVIISAGSGVTSDGLLELKAANDTSFDVIVIGPGKTLGFYNHAPAAQQTGVPVTAAGIHAALVALGLITA